MSEEKKDEAEDSGAEALTQDLVGQKSGCDSNKVATLY